MTSLASLAASYHEGNLRAQPVAATALGDRRYDDRLEDLTPEGIALERARLEGVLARARALHGEALGPADRLTLAVLVAAVEGDLAQLACGLHEWVVDPLAGPQVSLLNIASIQPVSTSAQGELLVARWRAMARYVDVHVRNLRAGLAAGKVATRTAVEKTIAELDELLETPDAEWALSRPRFESHPAWTQGERDAFRDGIGEALRDGLRPAFARYRDLVRDEVRPRARADDRAGLLHVPGGEEAYRRLVRVHTTLDASPDEVHGTGLREVARIDAEMEALGRRALGARDRVELLGRLRSDPSLHFASRDEVEDKARAALERANAAVPGWFGIRPRAACEVVRMEPHEEKHSTIAYYRQPAADGSRPGRYAINTYAPETRPRYEAEALAYHEAVPGHHLQIAIAQELAALPEFRKHLILNAYIEGWALYAERLADEMGLYSGDQDRIGRLSYEAWRACRLVVDTGIHARGWTRRQAVEFMLEHSALAANNVENEVDRYIVWPGQALSYKLGQLEILALRDAARRRLGDGFDIRGFHDVVLGEGSLPLGALRAAVEGWVERCAAGAGPAIMAAP